MSHDPLEERLREAALQINSQLNALTPHERALVWREVALHQNQNEPERALTAEEILGEEANLKNSAVLECLQIIRIYGRLSQSGRQTLMELATEMDTTERFERLIESGDFEKSENDEA